MLRKHGGLISNFDFDFKVFSRNATETSYATNEE